MERTGYNSFLPSVEGWCIVGMWEQVLLGAFALGIAVFFWPGIKKIIAESEQAEERDWKGVLIPVALVVLFVMLLIVLSKG